MVKTEHVGRADKTEVVIGFEPLPLPEGAPDPVVTQEETAVVVAPLAKSDAWGCKRGGRPAAINAVMSANPGMKFTLPELLVAVRPYAPTLQLSHLEDYFTWYSKKFVLFCDVVKGPGGAILSVAYRG